MAGKQGDLPLVAIHKATMLCVGLVLLAVPVVGVMSLIEWVVCSGVLCLCVVCYAI